MEEGAQVLVAVSQRKIDERRQSGTDGQTLWACSMRAGGGTARGHGERGAGTRGEAAPDMGLGLAGPGLGLVWPGSGLGWEWKTHIKQS